MTQPDFVVSDHGSIVILAPLTPAARDWRNEYLPADAMEYAGGVVIEPRYVGDILIGIVDAGLTVEPS